MRAAVIGANGYLARNLLKVNEEANYGETAPCGHQAEHMDHAPGYRQIDMTRQEQLEQAIDGCDLVYFFTGKTGTIQGFDTPEEFLGINERMLLRLLTAYRAVGSRAKIVFPSTRLVYRGSDSPLAEDAPKQFLTPYAAQKYACEQYLEMYGRLYGVRYCVMRICVPYGTLVRPVSSYGTVEFFLRQARENGQIRIYGDGSQRRTVTYIGDLCHALWQAGQSAACENDVFNVGGEALSIRELAEKVAEATGARVVESPWPESVWKVESGSTVFDSKKLDEKLCCRPAMTVSKWISEMMNCAQTQSWGGICTMKDTDMKRPGGVFCNHLYTPAATVVCCALFILSAYAGAARKGGAVRCE